MRTINKMIIQPDTPNDNKVLWLNKNNASYYNNGTWVTIGESSEDMRELEEKVDSLDVDMQTVENEIQDINSRHNTLNTKHESLSKTVQGIAVTGGASTATNVTYNNDNSGLNAENAQDAIDELQGSKIDKTSILQESGNAEDKVMSQKAVSDKLSDLDNNKSFFCGYAGKSTVPVAKPGNFYIAYEPGIYEHFGNLQIDGLSVIHRNPGNYWEKVQIASTLTSDKVGLVMSDERFYNVYDISKNGEVTFESIDNVLSSIPRNIIKKGLIVNYLLTGSKTYESFYFLNDNIQKESIYRINNIQLDQQVAIQIGRETGKYPMCQYFAEAELFTYKEAPMGTKLKIDWLVNMNAIGLYKNGVMVRMIPSGTTEFIIKDNYDSAKVLWGVIIVSITLENSQVNNEIEKLFGSFELSDKYVLFKKDAVIKKGEIAFTNNEISRFSNIIYLLNYNGLALYNSNGDKVGYIEGYFNGEIIKKRFISEDFAYASPEYGDCYIRRLYIEKEFPSKSVVEPTTLMQGTVIFDNTKMTVNSTVLYGLEKNAIALYNNKDEEVARIPALNNNNNNSRVHKYTITTPFSKAKVLWGETKTTGINLIESRPYTEYGQFYLNELKNSFRYVVPSFFSGTDKLNLFGTNDLINFYLFDSNVFVPTLNYSNSNSLRDPSICKIGEYWYIVYTTVAFNTETPTKIGMCRTKDFVYYEELPMLSVETAVENLQEPNLIWAPAFCKDIDDTIYIAYTIGYKDNNKVYKYFRMALATYNADSHTVSEGFVVKGINNIDGHFLYENGYYYIISQGFYLYKSNSLHGTFEKIRSIPNYEASFPIKLGNGKWRIFAQGVYGQLGNNKMYYLDTKGDSIESEWDEPKEIKIHYGDFNANLDGNNKLYPFHFTIYDFINHQ